MMEKLELKDILTSILENVQPAVDRRTFGVNTGNRPRIGSSEVRFNYQRHFLDHNRDRIISLGSVNLARITLYPKKSVHLYRISHQHRRAYRALKMLENLLYYQFNVEVTRDE